MSKKKDEILWTVPFPNSTYYERLVCALMNIAEGISCLLLIPFGRMTSWGSFDAARWLARRRLHRERKNIE